jgi:hypothetical protein
MSHSFAEALRLMHTNYVDGLLILAAAVGVGQPLTQPMDQLASATALNDVGIELRAQGRYGDAERVFRQALEIPADASAGGRSRDQSRGQLLPRDPNGVHHLFHHGLRETFSNGL